MRTINMNSLPILSSFLLLHSMGVAQNVVINTDGTLPTDPRAMLEVKKNLYSKLKVRSTHYMDTSVVELSNRTAANEGTDFRITAKRELGLFVTSASDLPVNTNDSLFTILTNGNVGIGTKGPFYPLQVHDGSSSNGYVNITNVSTGSGAGDGLLVGMSGTSGIVNNLENGNLRLGTNNLTRVTIDASGNMGVGNSTPVYKLDVSGDVNLTGLMRINGSAGTAGQVLTSNGSSDPQWRTTSFANNTRFAVDIGLTSPGTSSSVTGGLLNISGTKYNLDPSSVTIGSSNIIITRSGLYHFEVFYTIEFYYASPSTTISPILNSYLSINTTGFNYHLAYHDVLRHPRSDNSWYYFGKAGFDIYIQAPKVLDFYSALTDLGGPTNIVLQEGQLYGHLISD